MTSILFIHSSSELYGSDRSLLNIVTNLDKSKYSIHVILPCQGPLVDEMKRIDGVKVSIFEVAVLRRKNLSIKGGVQYTRDFLRSYRFLKNYIRKNDINIVDTNTAVVFPGAIAAKHLKRKSVWHIREIVKSKAENKAISAIMNHYADLIIANSETSGKAIIVDQKKIRVVYNAVADKCDSISEKLDNSSFVVGMAGRINRWKGQKLFVEAAEKIHKENPAIQFNIAGDAYSGEEYLVSDLQLLIDKKGLSDVVHLVGHIDDMDSFYRSLDVFVLPSIQPEPFGLVVIEAMEFGVPVVATNHGGPTEIINNGVDGFLVDYHSPEEMADRILRIINDPQLSAEIGNAGRHKKRELFSISAMVSEVDRVLEEVLIVR